MIRKVRKGYERERVPTKVGTVSRTKQSFTDECDINKIVKRFQTTGAVGHLNVQRPIYADVSNMDGLQAAMEAVELAQDSFDGMHADLRQAANHDPVEFLRMMSTEEGREILATAGFEDEPREPVVEEPPAREVNPKPGAEETPVPK